MTLQAIVPAPPLPTWLAAEYPFRRQMFHGARYAMHYVDEGQGDISVLLLHGNPTWSFLWRKVIALLADHPLHIIAPDLIGLGLSGKPSRVASYSLEMQVDHLQALVQALDLRQVILVGQDWGGPIGAAMAAREEPRIQAALFANTVLRAPRQPHRLSTFHRLSHIPVLSELLFRGLNFPMPILRRVQGDRHSIDRIAMRAYRYPLSRWRTRAAPLALARMVPMQLDHPSMAGLHEAEHWAHRFDRPVRLIWGMRDPILGRALPDMQELFAQAQVTQTSAGHFLQEEVPGIIANAILELAGDLKSTADRAAAS